MTLKEVFRRLKSQRLSFFSFIFLLILGFIAIFAPFIVPHDPLEHDLSKVLMGPSLTHLLGTDELGRDIFSRLLMGTRAAFQAGAIAILIPLFIGVPLGILAGYIGGIVDDIFMRIVDGILSIPTI